MKGVLATVTIGEAARKLAGFTHPTFERFADRYMLDFRVLDERHQCGPSPHYTKMRCGDLLEEYDRVIFCDTDVLIAPDCPNLLDIVPQNLIGACLVSVYADHYDRGVTLIQDHLGDVGWDREYFNSGVIVVSRCHKAIFDTTDSDFCKWTATASGKGGRTLHGFDQTYLNYKAKKLGFPIYHIGYQFNHSLASRNSEQRFASHIIHCKGHRRGNRLTEVRRAAYVLDRPKFRRLFVRFPWLVRLYDIMP